ncbi:MAG: FMN-binding glutamate synthase family protein [Ectothiorhodospiraceae bacterium]|nr:FMN-binding glutamate synthase family protein [Ectothiorhodospiraceae bacterium]
MRFLVYAAVLALTALAAADQLPWIDRGWALAVLLPFVALGTWNLLQSSHSLLRNYPLVGHVRWLFEEARPYLRQYVVESNLDGRPFSREQRSVVYQRAKDLEGVRPFGTETDVYGSEYEWIEHSMAALPHDHQPLRVTIGGDQCARPYDASVLDISAMSFGSLGARAIEALNLGAKLGGFAHDTGEGGISRYHRIHGGDIIWEIGSGYFGCRDERGRFDPARFADQAADDQIKMVEVKLSQGAKPGHGGMLPGPKVTAEIAEARGVPAGQDCVSPPFHSAFSTPIEMIQFLGRLRELAGGKPVGFKLCIGQRWEFLALCKAMLETGIRPDFVVVDGAEGGTGAAPAEFSDHVGAPLRDGLVFVRNALVGTGLRDHIRIGASGKIVTGFGMAANMAMGADWCNSARGFMFALGCVQSLRCHTNTCPTGVATQDPGRQRALVVADKAPRVARFHRNTVEALASVVAAAGLAHPRELRPHHVWHRLSAIEARPADRVYRFLAPRQYLDDPDSTEHAAAWRMADANSFRPRTS